MAVTNASSPVAATMTRTSENGTALEPRTAWSVLVIYEDVASREQAVDFCDQLVKRFWTRFEFDVSWWSFDLLQQEPVATETAAKAARADLVVVSSTLPGDLPASIKNWIESWLDRRGDQGHARRSYKSQHRRKWP